MKPKVSIIYVYFNTPGEIKKSINSIKNAIGNISYEIIVIDNNSSVKIFSKLFKNLNIRIIINKSNKGFGKAANIAVDKSNGKYLLIVNPDTLFHTRSISQMIDKIERNPSIGIVGPKMVTVDNETLPTISGFPKLPDSFFAFTFLNWLFPRNEFSRKYWLTGLSRDREQDVDVVSGACIVIKKSIFKQVKGFDERFFMYFEETDLCKKVKNLGYKIIFFPRAKITHLIGKSSDDKNWIKSVYQQSRFRYFRKYYGFFTAIISECILRTMSLPFLLIVFVLFISAFLNLYKINSLMLFIGDFGRDYLAARDMILSGKIPLVGITSSVIWLHQGPLSIYFIGLSFLIGRFNPVAPAIFYASVGIVTTFLVYKLGSIIFNNTYIGVLAALLYATSPLVVINERMPYHTSSIPFFACLFFYLLLKTVDGRRSFFSLFFILGLLFQLELSNGVLFLLLFIILWRNKSLLSRREVYSSLMGFIMGIFPFLLYDLNHHFIQTIGFLLWVFNRIRLFVGLTVDYHSTRSSLPFAMITIWEQISRQVYPSSQLIVLLLIFLSVLGLIFAYMQYSNKRKRMQLLLLWMWIPLCGFLVHAAPGTAYFPLIFPSIAILIAGGIWSLSKKTYIIPFVVLLALFNTVYIIKNDYFLTTKQQVRVLPPGDYSFGSTWTIQDEIVKSIVQDTKGQPFSLKAGGFIKTLTTGLDNYKYLVWWHGGTIVNKASLTYTIYQSPKEIPSDVKIQFSNSYVFVQKHQE